MLCLPYLYFDVSEINRLAVGEFCESQECEHCLSLIYNTGGC